MSQIFGKEDEQRWNDSE
ncbi:hypothetical protein RDI58_029065 [Solanum bulbocastanum]|uniref:Uncharacterized protein n=1 Tax=Solanum bulbocastanum TaxID=147425 RepID=A0AAN8SXD8_SOLBU